MYELHHLIEKFKERKVDFEKEYTEEEEILKVRDILNKRLTVIREKLYENPSNDSLLLEYGFCQEEYNKLTAKLEYLRKKFATKEAKIEKYEKLRNYNLQELYTYVDFMKQFNMDDKLYQAMQDTLISLERNIDKLDELRKNDD